jgi:hypothetical protein
MGIISVTGPQFGQRYNVNIAGNAPTPEEQARIDQFVAQQEASMAARVQERFGAPAAAVAPEAPVEEDDGTAFGRGLATGVQSIRSLLGTYCRGGWSRSWLRGCARVWPWHGDCRRSRVSQA